MAVSLLMGIAEQLPAIVPLSERKCQKPVLLFLLRERANIDQVVYNLPIAD